MNLFFAILAVTVAGYAIASTVRIRGARREDVLLLRLGLVPGIGFGLLSIWYFVWLAMALAAWVEIGVEILIVVGAAAWLYFTYEPLSETNPPPRATTGFLLAAITSVAGLIASYWIRYTREPLGFWDAWAIWNVHARILDRASLDWPSAIRASAHPDYPVLLPLTVARLWHSLRAEPTWVPALVGFIFLMGAIAILYGALGILSRRDAACIGIVVLAMNLLVSAVASDQCADWPLAYFFTACVALLLLGRRTMLLAGLMAGMAAWTKNEGLLFALVLGLTFGVIDRRAWRALLPPVALLVAVVLWYKWTIHVPNDLFQPSGVVSIAGWSDPRPLLVRVTDYHRLRLIISNFSEQLAGFVVWLSPAVILALQASRTGERLDLRLQVRSGLALRACVVMLLLMIAGYVAVFVITPVNVQRHLETSVDRLFVQLWPSTVLCVLTAIMPSTQTLPDTAATDLRAHL